MVDPSSLAGIVSAVRKIIFDWSLKLEAAGIQGDGISFDELAKRRAHEPAIINSVGKIENFYGVMGTASGSSWKDKAVAPGSPESLESRATA